MEKIQFEIQEHHILLAKRFYVSWEDAEFGAPCIDPKRPYGNSAVLQDISEILGKAGETCPHCGELLDDSSDANAEYEKIHEEMETVLQILLDNAHKGIKVGVYHKEEYGGIWKPIEESA